MGNARKHHLPSKLISIEGKQLRNDQRLEYDLISTVHQTDLFVLFKFLVSIVLVSLKL